MSKAQKAGRLTRKILQTTYNAIRDFTKELTTNQPRTTNCKICGTPLKNPQYKTCYQCYQKRRNKQ